MKNFENWKILRLVVTDPLLQLFAKKNATGSLVNKKKVFFFSNNNNNNSTHSLTKATRTQAIDHQITSTVVA